MPASAPFTTLTVQPMAQNASGHAQAAMAPKPAAPAKSTLPAQSDTVIPLRCDVEKTPRSVLKKSAA